MRKIVVLTAVLMMFASAAIAEQRVGGYLKKDGTYVQPYYRTSPNSNPYDNYSTKGNTNPYTGQEGTKNPYPYYPYGQKPSNNYDSDSKDLE